MRTPIQGDLAAGVARTTDRGGLAPALLDAIENAGGLWHAGDYLAPLQTMPALAAVIGRPKDGPHVDFPFLEELPPDHPLRREWRDGTQSSEHPAGLRSV